MTYVPIRDRASTPHELRRTPTSDAPGATETAPLHTVLPLLVAYGALAPSPYNTQPWHFRTSPSALEIRLDHMDRAGCRAAEYLASGDMGASGPKAGPE